MGHLVAVILAMLCRLYGVNIFRNPKDVGSGPLVSSYMFIFTLFLLFYDLKIFPTSLRSLGGLSQIVIEFLMIDFLMENLVVDFWFPLEIVVMGSLDHLSHNIQTLLEQGGGWKCGSICDYLERTFTKIVVSYFLSSFILVCVVHAIRAIDLRALKEGPYAFFGDIWFRLKKFFRRKQRYFGLAKNRRVKLNAHPRTSSAARKAITEKSLSDYEISDDDICL